MPAVPLRLGYFGDPNATHTRRWISWFSRHGHHVTLYVSPGIEVAPGLEPGIEVSRWRPYGGGPLKPLRYVAARRSLRELVRTTQPDLVHAHYLTTYGWLAWLSGARPYGVTAWGSDVYLDLGASRRNASFGRLALRGAAFVTADSRDLADACIAGGASRERTTVVQFGVEVDRFAAPPRSALRTALGLDGKRLIFSPRQIAPIYNHEVVLRAVQMLRSDTHVLMSARDAFPDELARITQVIADLGLEDRVTIVPEIAYDDMAAVHALASVVVSIPWTDATPVTLFESLAAGTPIVVSDLPSLREWLGEVTPDLIVPVGDPEATAAAIQRALDMAPASREALAGHLRAIAWAEGDHDRNMERVESLYLAAVRGDPVTPIADPVR
jgi:glycosyltransferase involved in cell wall biosynthesis